MNSNEENVTKQGNEGVRNDITRSNNQETVSAGGTVESIPNEVSVEMDDDNYSSVASSRWTWWHINNASDDLWNRRNFILGIVALVVTTALSIALPLALEDNGGQSPTPAKSKQPDASTFPTPGPIKKAPPPTMETPEPVTSAPSRSTASTFPTSTPIILTSPPTASSTVISQQTPEEVTIWDGEFGSFKGWVGQGPNFYACGARMRSESYQGSFVDDTAANGIELRFCSYTDWSSQVDLSIYDGIWGSWSEWIMCGKDLYIDGGQIRYEDYEDIDDNTALNGMNIRCRHKISGKTSDWITIEDGIFGNWKTEQTRENKFVTHANVKFQNEQGTFGDDTAMNGLKFRFLNPDLA